MNEQFAYETGLKCVGKGDYRFECDFLDIAWALCNSWGRGEESFLKYFAKALIVNWINISCLHEDSDFYIDLHDENRRGRILLAITQEALRDLCPYDETTLKFLRDHIDDIFSGLSAHKKKQRALEATSMAKALIKLFKMPTSKKQEQDPKMTFKDKMDQLMSVGSGYCLIPSRQKEILESIKDKLQQLFPSEEGMLVSSLIGDVDKIDERAIYYAVENVAFGTAKSILLNLLEKRNGISISYAYHFGEESGIEALFSRNRLSKIVQNVGTILVKKHPMQLKDIIHIMVDDLKSYDELEEKKKEAFLNELKMLSL